MNIYSGHLEVFRDEVITSWKITSAIANDLSSVKLGV